jgi:Lon protease-like protein
MTGLNLPKKCGVMILPDCTLFPHGGLPLFIFEERYRLMLDRALEGDCIFAVARQSEPHAASIGTVGLVRASREREDGTSELLLHGVIRVKFSEWLDDEAFPTALIEPVLGQPLDKDQADEAGLMADLVAQQLIQGPDLRQLLLETIPAGERVALLCQFLEKIKFGE